MNNKIFNLKLLISSEFLIYPPSQKTESVSARELYSFGNYKLNKNLKSEIDHPRQIRAGFTLIELLVVMMIVAILAGISLFALQGARSQGRDARRKSDLEVIRSGIELFKADCNTYPSNSCLQPGNSLRGSASCGCSPSNSNVYIEEIPDDPSNDFNYYYNRTSANTYNLCATLEEGGSTTPSGCSSGGCGSSPCRYKVTQP